VTKGLKKDEAKAIVTIVAIVIRVKGMSRTLVLNLFLAFSNLE